MAFMAAIPIMSYVSMAAAAVTAAASISAAQQNKKIADVNAENATNAAITNKNLADAKAIQEEASGQIAASQKRHDLELRLSRAQAVAASQGGGPPQEALISGLIDKGETAASYDLYSSTERAKTLRFQGEQGLQTTIGQGEANVAAAKVRENQAMVQGAGSVLGSVGKGLSLSGAFAPGAAPGIARTATDAYSDALYGN